MNTTSSPVAQSDTPAVDRPLTVNPPVAVDIDTRLAQIEAERARITELDAEAARLRHEKELVVAKRRAEVINTLPGLLQVETLDQVVALIRGLNPTSPTKGFRYSDETRAQVRKMMEADTPIAQIAKHMRIGEATLWLWKRAWGLTHTPVRQPKPRHVAAPRRGNRQKAPMSPARKAELIVRIKEGKTPIAKLAKEFGVSRARAYQIVAREHLSTPGALKAA